jgi:histone-lysine N-methyltransferase SETMAR
VQEFFTKNKVAVVPHPPYSPVLTPSDYFFFPKMKIKLKGRRIDTDEEIQVQTQMVLSTLTKKYLQDAVPKGNYFEDDSAE